MGANREEVTQRAPRNIQERLDELEVDYNQLLVAVKDRHLNLRDRLTDLEKEIGFSVKPTSVEQDWPHVII